MVDLTWTNTWLAILALISLIQFLMMCVAGFLAYRMYQKAMTTLETVERVHIAPLRARVDAMLDQVQLMTDKVSHAQESVSDALKHVTGTGSAVAGAVKSKAWPIVGILQGLKSVANSMMGNGRRDQSTTGRTTLCRLLLHACVEPVREKSGISSRYARCNKRARPDSFSGFLRTAPLQCAEHHKLGRRPTGASSRHFMSWLVVFGARVMAGGAMS